jgi:DNA-binding FrmR family transcriptional regulator
MELCVVFIFIVSVKIFKWCVMRSMSLTSECEAVLKRVEAVYGVVGALQQELGLLRRLVEGEAKKSEALSARLSSVETQISSARSELGGRVDAVLQQISALGKALGSAVMDVKGVVEGVRGDVRGLSESLSALRGGVGELGKDVRGLYDRLDSVERGLASVEERLLRGLDAFSQQFSKQLEGSAAEVRRGLKEVRDGVLQVSSALETGVGQINRSLGELRHRVDDGVVRVEDVQKRLEAVAVWLVRAEESLGEEF